MTGDGQILLNEESFRVEFAIKQTGFDLHL